MYIYIVGFYLIVENNVNTELDTNKDIMKETITHTNTYTLTNRYDIVIYLYI